MMESLSVLTLDANSPWVPLLRFVGRGSWMWIILKCWVIRRSLEGKPPPRPAAGFLDVFLAF